MKKLKYKHKEFWKGILLGIILGVLIIIVVFIFVFPFNILLDRKDITQNQGTEEYQRLYNEAQRKLLINEWCILKCKEYGYKLISYNDYWCNCATPDKQIRKIEIKFKNLLK